MKRIRIILGTFLAPLIVGLFYSTLPGTPNLEVTVVEVYPVAFILWLPTFIYCYHRGWIKVSQLFLAGIVLGLIVGILSLFVLILIGRLGTLQEFSFALGIFTIGSTIMGSILAVTFWIIALSGSRRRE